MFLGDIVRWLLTKLCMSALFRLLEEWRRVVCQRIWRLVRCF